AFADWREVGPSLVVLPEGRTELIRIDARAAVQVPLAGTPRVLAARRDAVVLAVATPVGEAIVVLDGDGRAQAYAPTTARYDVTPPDDGHWLFVPEAPGDRTFELCKPDGEPIGKLPRRFTKPAMPPPRRCAGGWLVTNILGPDRVYPIALTDAALQV